MKVALPLTLALACSLASHPGRAAESNEQLKLLHTIPLSGVKGRFDHFAIDLKGRRLFVAALGNNTLEVLDIANVRRLHSIKDLHKPTGVLYIPESNRIAVANGDDGTLKVYDGSSYELVNRLNSLDDADNLRYDPEKKLAYLGYGDGALAVIDATAWKQLASIKLQAHPESFQLERTGPRIFVNVPDAKQVAVIDRASRAIIAIWPMAEYEANFPMSLDERGHRLFVGCRKPAQLVVLDARNGKAVAKLAISGDTDDLFYDPELKCIYVSCGEGFVDVIAERGGNQYQRVNRIRTRSGARTSFFSAERREFYLAVPQQGSDPAELRIYATPGQ